MLKQNNTNVQPSELNYDNYETEIYDDDIRRSIPGYEPLHYKICEFIADYIKSKPIHKILELGVGTGLTSERILNMVPNASLIAIDFSEQMIKGAKKRLHNFHVEYILDDYSETKYDNDFDLVVSVISIHHQSYKGKKELFAKIYNSLKPGGAFIFGDIFTFKDKHKSALNDAKHFHHMVVNARNEQSLKEWAYHHKVLNLLANIEEQVIWLKNLGFSNVEIEYEYFNTGLLIAIK